MISFIIIGKNEGWKLSKCIRSVYKTVEFNELPSFEIIYVDSDSSDGSVEIAKVNDLIKVYKITGDINAAIARNVGVENSSGNVLFFIDGDMEIQPEFLRLVYSEENGLVHHFVSGNWMNYYYNFSDELLRKEKYIEMKEDHYEKVTGGFFLINRKAWDLVGGMNNKFKKSQDTDLGLQLAKKEIFLLRKKDTGVIHHTIDYLDKKRMWKDFFSGNHLYSRSYLYRNHLFNKYMYHRLFKNDYTLLIMILGIISLIVFGKLGIAVLAFYILTVLIRSKFNLVTSIYFILRDLLVLVGFFIFIPKNNIYKVELINR